MKKSDRELLQAALCTIETIDTGLYSTDKITSEIRARLAERKLEPGAWVASKSSDGKADALYWNSRDAEEDGYAFIEPLYRHPPRQDSLDKLIEQIRFLEQQIAERKNQ